MPNDTTHFGYQQVPTEEKQAKVAQVFDSVAQKYDLMNDVMSLGLHRYWKAYTLQCARAKSGQVVLDIAGGTGDLAKQFSHQVGAQGRVILADINANMLAVGRDHLINAGTPCNIDYIQANAENLPFADNTFDIITISFGLRNVTHQQNALESMLRVLKPGGQLLILEFSKPVIAPLKPIYDIYSFKILPKLGQWIADDTASYQYLAESIRMHPDQATLLQMMQTAGFSNTCYLNLTGGIVALHRGFKV